jgi:deoxycytidylate deaminase
MGGGNVAANAELKLGEAPVVKQAKNPLEQIKDRETQELVIALCGPIGSPLHFSAERFAAVLGDRFGYTTKIIRLSEIISDRTGVKLDGLNYLERTHKLIESGNNLRLQYGSQVLAELAINDIRIQRETEKILGGNAQHLPRRVCHIIDSIKNVQELEMFKAVYQDLFFFVGVYSSLEFRTKKMRDKIDEEREISELIDRDSGEETNEGQQVKDVFSKADFFLRVEKENSQEVESRVLRFLDVMFRTSIVSPTTEETAMYLAHSAASNSACLSRQVGACLTDAAGEVLSVGWNDVPKFGGGLYSQVDGKTNEDHRCYLHDGGTCFNDLEKDKLSVQLADELIKEGIIAETKREQLQVAIRKTRIKDLIEFSRSIHAEMHAILQAAQKTGDRILRGRLFVTTMPCHSCARHIIAAGISEVYYIEPYRKSMALKLHSDAISVETEESKVQLVLFDGVSPTRYLECFRNIENDRKKDGKLVQVDRKKATPLVRPSLDSFLDKESIVIKSMVERELVLEGDMPNVETPKKPA